MENKKNILVIEDEPDILEVIKFNLVKESHIVKNSNDGERGLALARDKKFDLILLDLMLPGIHGLDVCRILKTDNRTSAVPIIIISALGQEADIVKGLETGADDYITKPFSSNILIARVNAVIRRNSNGQFGKEDSFSVEGIKISLKTRNVIIDNCSIELTFTEFQILFLLTSHPGWVFTRYQIINRIRGENYPVTDRSVDFQIVGLRKKIGKKGKLIETIRGVGYRFHHNET
ncbi:MAG: DNA-binding response regulator [Candidatus Marinimicrobia bacterium]|nr:DNA-binding response regulator [Candidatus Neomarinimicrobiota bacterium]